jgi:UDP-glucose:(heptosyl)LPS alpha-1,3-glucosyltransferase
LRFAFGIVSLIPKGGLQLDCMHLAHILRHRGHQVTIFTSRPLRQRSPLLDIAVLPVKALTNHGRDLGFAKRFRAAVKGGFDRVLGFNKLLDLELLYCADPSVHDKRRGWLMQAMPRHRVQLRLEEACFAPTSRTHILALSQALADSYRRHWNTPADRFSVPPPVIDPARQRPHLRTAEHRATVRRALGLPLDRPLWLWVGTKPETKGLDRVIEVLQRMPEVFLAALGVEERSAEGRRVLPRIQHARVSERVRFLGYRDDVPDVMAAADLLVHPTRLDVTGKVVLEAMVNGLPVVTSELCGFATYIREAGAGVVLPEPYTQSVFEAALRAAMVPSQLASFSQNGIHYGMHQLPMIGLLVVADIIEGKTVLQTPRPVAQPRGEGTAESR